MNLPENLKNEQDFLAREAISESAPFIKAVTELADKREILASEDIYASNGMKLVSNGARLSGGFYDRLVAHKLLRPIEQSLSLADALDSVRLAALIHDQAGRVPSLSPVLGQPDLREQLFALFGDLNIPAALALKLSVMQEDRPKLFQHGLIAAMISTVLGIRAHLPREELQALALASVFHDVGELCIDPAILATEHHMTSEERRHLYVHPITGFLILRDFPDLPKGTANAVLQHHERLDGSGYPYRLPGEQITVISRYLAVSEVAASLLEKQGADKRINMKLRLNGKKYDVRAIALIGQLFSDAQPPSAQMPDEVQVMTRLAQVGIVFEGWIVLRKTLSSSNAEPLSFLVERVDGMRRMVIEIGFDPCRLGDALAMAGNDNPETGMELTVLLDELEWQFKALSREIERKQPEWHARLPAALKAGFDGWLEQLHQFVRE